MSASDAVIIALLLVSVGGVVALLLSQRRSTGTESPIETDPADLDQLRTSRTDDGGLALMLGGEREPLLELSPLRTTSVEALSGRRPVKFDPWAPAGPAALLASLLTFLPATERTTVYVVKFRPEAEALLNAGRAQLVATRDGTMATIRGDLGRFAGNARIVTQHTATLTTPQLLAVAAVIGVVLHKLDEISEAVARIEAQLDELVQRLRDDDHGELEAAEALVTVLMPTLSRGVIPGQLALELAVARQRVDSIYFSRQRFVERFRLRIVELQDKEESRKGDNARAWARGTTREFSQQEALREEALIYARAMVDRAQLAFCTAAVVALQEGGGTAISLLRHAEQELKSSYFELNQLLQDLAEERPKWAWVPFNDRKEVHDTARSLAVLFGEEVAPLLPRPSGRTLEFTMATVTDEAPAVELDRSTHNLGST